jgi:hypothetical protein
VAQKLELSNLIELAQLPETMKTLNALKRLLLRFCCKLEALPQEMRGARALKTLDFVCLDQLQTLPDSMSKLNDLENFGISSCLMLKEPQQKVVGRAGIAEASVLLQAYSNMTWFDMQRRRGGSRLRLCKSVSGKHNSKLENTTASYNPSSFNTSSSLPTR